MSQMPILRSLLAAGGEAASDSELLGRFAEANDHAAFELVVRRHAELVWGVCRSAMPADLHAAEDAFQATFLILARKAKSIRDGSAAGWLFRVARNVAVRARAGQRNAPLPDEFAAQANAVEDELVRREIAPVVAEEVDRLAAKLREPVVLCFFEGHTHAEAATRLGWPVGTVASRLARAKELLRTRLTRRGVVLPAAGLAGVFVQTPASAASRVQAALALATGPADRVPPTILSLTQEVLSAMRFTHFKLIAAGVLVAAGLSVALAATATHSGQPAGATTGAANSNAEPPKPAAGGKPKEDKRLKALQGKWRAVQSTNTGIEIPLDQLAATPPTVVKGDEWVDDDGKSNTPFTMKIQFPTDAGADAIDFVITGGPKEVFGTVLPGRYRLEGDTMTICLRDMEHLKKGRPKNFEPDKTNSVGVLDRVTDEKTELKAFAGEWKVVRANFDNREKRAADLKNWKWTFEKDELQFTGGEEGKATIKLDPAATPPTIELTATEGNEKGSVMRGIYFRQGGRITLAFTEPRQKGAGRPKEFKPEQDVALIVLEREPKK